MTAILGSMSIRLTVLIAALASFSPRALAQTDDLECDDVPSRRPVYVTPAHMAVGATLGAPVRVRYTDGYFEDPTVGMSPEESIFLWRCAADDFLCTAGEPLSGTVQVIGNELIFRADAPFEPNTRYGGVALGADGDGLEFVFTTGTSFDSEAPSFTGIRSLASDRVGPSCEAPEGGYRIDVKVEPATDDGPGGDVEYLLYLTRGPEVEAPQLRSRQRNFSGEEIPMAFVIDPSEAVSPICVAVHAVDGVGRVTESPAECFDPIQGNFFEPLCSVSAAGAARSPWALPVVLACSVLCLIRVRRR